MRDELYAMSSVILNDIAMLRSEKIKVVEVIDDIRGCNMMLSLILNEPLTPDSEMFIYNAKAFSTAIHSCINKDRIYHERSKLQKTAHG